MEVLFCRENLLMMGRKAFDQLNKVADTRLRIQEIKCIIACSDCADSHIARVNGKLIVAPSAEELVKQILEFSQEIN